MRSSDTGIMLIIGVAKKNQFESHAWICKNDRVVFGGSESASQFTKLVAFK